MFSTCEVLFVKTHPDAKLPTRGHEDVENDITGLGTNIEGTGDTGYDITAVAEVTIPAKGSAVVPTGITVGYITPGFWWKVESRSGLSFKHSVLAHPGIIDNQYRGDTGVKLYNFSDKDHVVVKGDRVAQLVVYPLIAPEIGWTEQALETDRGSSGFGSTGQ